jgi:hypothetical protein
LTHRDLSCKGFLFVRKAPIHIPERRLGRDQSRLSKSWIDLPLKKPSRAGARPRGVEENIESDRRDLTTLMDRLNIDQSPLRKAGRWLAEQVIETKLAFDDEIGGILREFERLEALALGIDGKLALWRALAALSELDSRLSGVDYERLIQRCRSTWTCRGTSDRCGKIGTPVPPA